MATKVIDISYHNGDINFNQLKQAGVQLIIRCGYGNNSYSQDDKKFNEYITKAMNLNIPTALYIYSYATTTKEAISEADHICRLAHNYRGKISNTLWFDVEENGSAKENALVNFETFRKAVNAMGWKAGLYTSEYYFNTSKLTLIDSAVPLWIAKYGTNDGYAHKKPTLKGEKEVAMWQYTSKGKVQGIKGDCDISMCFKPYDLFNTEVIEMDIDTALKILVNKGVISTPDYWYNAIKCVKYLEDLLINMAKTYSE